VLDENGLPLPGAAITVKGTGRGTTSDFDGSFEIEAKKGERLVISYMGFETINFWVGTDNLLKITLPASFDGLDEVVVTGLSIKKKSLVRGYNSIGTVMNDSEMVEVEEDAATMPPDFEKTAAAENKPGGKNNGANTDFSQVSIRKNLRETAFFFPQLQTDKNGNISFNFTTPEALTKWKVQLLSHTKNLESNLTQHTTVTQKELMVLPNAPRFLREGDTIRIQSKISNLSEKALNGEAVLQLTNAVTGATIDGAFNNTNAVKNFSVTAAGNTQVSWSLTVPDTAGAVQYKIIAKAGGFSDGEQNVLPVLSNRMLVTETLPMWVRSNEARTFTLDKLKNHTSATLKNHKLTLEVTSNPAWYAVQALPYLMEYPYDCNEQMFSKLYANTLAGHIA
ncbi:MAG: alpha-2-macroglobulin family protein, partial [Marinirhabdus sp.]